MAGRIRNRTAFRWWGLHCIVVLLPVGLWLAFSTAGCAPYRQRGSDSGLHAAIRACMEDTWIPKVTSVREAAFWAGQHERAGSEACVDLYFLAATLSHPGSASPTDQEIYHRSLAGLIRTAQQFGRYDPVQGIRVRGADGPSTVAISYHGFSWKPCDFSRLVIADRFVRTRLEMQYFREGLGVPLIVIREQDTPERFYMPRTHFAATANLNVDCQPGADCGPVWTLELANPLVIDCTCADSEPTPLAADYSAPTRYTKDREKRNYLNLFLRPGSSTAEPKLILMEPYQRGKIPLVFIHGLLSDPMTWAELYETLKADPELRDRYQFWAFQYPTGTAFLRSAAILRQELATVVARVDPAGEDPALSQMVLVSHSMGGLLAKLQVTSSGDRIWQSFANRPMDTLQTTPEMRELMQELFYFEPSAHVQRIVYIGTPHNGSGLANRLVGRIGAHLVRVPEAEKREYQAFLTANPGVVHEFASKRIPTSIDVLEPDNPLLDAMSNLAMAPCVTTHSIIGTGGCAFACEPSDGVVPVASAHISGVESELFVDEDHEDLHRDPETIEVVERILRRHLQCVDGQ